MLFRSTDRAKELLKRLPGIYPDAHCELDHTNPLELLVATMLSAQCTDKRVNLVTRGLFQRCRTANDYAGISQEELEGLVRSTGFYRNKAKNIRAMAAKLLADEIETARYSAAYYKTALEEIIRTTHPTNGAHEIARRFLKLDDETGDDE